jgi:MFS family permease
LALGFIAATVFVDMVGYGLIVPLLPLFVQRLGGNATLAGLFAASYALVQAVCGPPLGSLADRYGRRPVLLVCLVGSGLGYLLLGLADSIWLLLAALALDAMTGGNVSVAQAYVADISNDTTRARNFGILGVAFGLGVTTGPALAALLIGYGYGVPVFVAAGLAFANAAFGSLALPESRPATSRREQAPGVLGVLRLTLATARLPGLRQLLPIITLVNLSFAVLQSTFALFSATRFGWNAQSNATLFACVGIGAVATQALLLPYMQARLGERRLAAAGALLLGLGIWALAAAPSAPLLYPAAVLAALGSNLAVPSLTSLLAANAGPHGHGRALGAMQLAVNAALVGGPLAGGLLFDHVAPTAPLLLGGLAGALAALLLARTGERQPSEVAPA